MFEMHLISGITDGWQGCEPPPLSQAKCKNRPSLPSLYFESLQGDGSKTRQAIPQNAR